MAESKSEVKEFLSKSEQLLGSKSAAEDFAEVLKRENTRQIKEQLAIDLEPLLSLLATIERQQARIIKLLEEKADLDVEEKEIMDLLKAKIQSE